MFDGRIPHGVQQVSSQQAGGIGGIATVASSRRQLCSCIAALHTAPHLAHVFTNLTPSLRQVSGTMDPREGRIVLHGWFTSPSPYFSSSGLLLLCLGHSTTRSVICWATLPAN